MKLQRSEARFLLKFYVEIRQVYFAMSGQPYLCKWKNRPRNTPQMLHWQRKQSVENSPNRPTSGTATAPYSSRLQVKRHFYIGVARQRRVADEAVSAVTCSCARCGGESQIIRTSLDKVSSGGGRRAGSPTQIRLCTPSDKTG